MISSCGGQRTEERLNKAGEFVDHERFSQEVIHGLKSGQPFSYRKFDCGDGPWRNGMSSTKA